MSGVKRLASYEVRECDYDVIVHGEHYGFVTWFSSDGLRTDVTFYCVKCRKLHHRVTDSFGRYELEEEYENEDDMEIVKLNEYNKWFLPRRLEGLKYVYKCRFCGRKSLHRLLMIRGNKRIVECENCGIVDILVKRYFKCPKCGNETVKSFYAEKLVRSYVVCAKCGQILEKIPFFSNPMLIRVTSEIEVIRE